MRFSALEKKKTRCPLLGGRYLLACRRNPLIYMPSLFEMEEYCTTMRHVICPLYCGGNPGPHRPDSGAAAQERRAG